MRKEVYGNKEIYTGRGIKEVINNIKNTWKFITFIPSTKEKQSEVYAVGNQVIFIYYGGKYVGRTYIERIKVKKIKDLEEYEPMLKTKYNKLVNAMKMEGIR